MTSLVFKIGIIGLGIGESHAWAFQELGSLLASSHQAGMGFEVAALCDLDLTRLAEVAALFPSARTTTDFDQLLRMEELDIIDICTPSHLHHSQALAALAAGKKVILEKPAAGSLQQIDEIIAAAGSPNSLQVMPIFQQRFGQGVQKLKHLQSRGLCGRAYLTTVETAWRRRPDYYATWHGKLRTELGGALVTLGIHAHDVACYVLGPAQRVSAFMATRVNPIETEDCVTASLQMADGSLGSLAVTTGCAAEITRHHFCFSNLSATSSTLPYANTSDPWAFSGDTEEIQAQIEAALAEFVPMPEGLVGQFYRYYYALLNSSPPPVTLADARTAIELITATYYAAETGTTVDLPIPPDHPRYTDWRPLSVR